MKRQRKTHLVQVGDFAFTSQVSASQAKEQANQHIAAAYTDIQKYTPYIHEWRGNIGIMWRTVDGYLYRVLWSDRDTVNNGRTSAFSCTGRNEQETIDAMLSHIAQHAWVWTDGETGPDFLTPSQLQSFRYWAQFQLSCMDGEGNYLPSDQWHK